MADAFLSETEISISDHDIPPSLDLAEQIRDEAAKAVGPIAAWKLGATIAGVRQTLGLCRPFFGPVPASCVFDDGAELSGFHTRLRGVEGEYGFVLARDVGPEDAECDDAEFANLFSCIRPALEVPGTRFASLGRYGGLGLIADFGAVGGVVLGSPRQVGNLSDLDSGMVGLFLAEKEVAGACASIIDGGAAGPIRTFIRQATAAGFALQRGQTILTGSCTGYVKANMDQPVRATFQALDRSVSVRFVSEQGGTV